MDYSQQEFKISTPMASQQQNNNFDVKAIIIDWLQPKLVEVGSNLESVSESQDLYELGAVDSLDFVELVYKIEKKTGIRANLDTFSDKRFAMSIEFLTQAFKT